MPALALIFGASGFVGRHLASYLAEQDVEVHGAGRSANPAGRDWPGDWHQCDVTDPDQVLTVVRRTKPGYVFDLAALIKGRELVDLLAVNVSGTQNVLDAVRRIQPRARALVTGSAAEYGIQLATELPIDESNQLRPVTLYGISKVAQSLLALHYARSQRLNVLCTRTFNLTGPGEPDSFVCASYARQIAEIEAGLRPATLQVVNPEKSRDFVDVRDAVRAYWLAAQYGKAGALYNVCSGRPTSIADVVNALVQMAKVKIYVHEMAERITQDEGDVHVQVGSYNSLRAAVGWEPQIPLAESLGANLDRWRAFYRPA